MIAAQALIAVGTVLLTAGAIFPFGSIHDAKPHHVLIGAAVGVIGIALILWGAFL